MARALLQTVNQSIQAVTPDANVPAIINLGTAVHGYGCGIKLSGNGIQIEDSGYFKINCNVSVAPTAAGPVTVALYNGSNQIEGAIAYGSVSTAENPITLPLQTVIRRGCNCNGSDSITVRLIAGAGNVQNISTIVEKS